MTARSRRASALRPAALVALLAATALSLSAQSPKPAAVLMQAAAAKATIEGDFKGAAALYDEAAARALAEGNRALAADALVGAGEAYRASSDARADERFARVVREFSDQVSPAGRARRQVPASAGTTRSLTPSGGLPAFRSVATLGEADGVAGNVSADGRYVPFIRWDEGALFVRELATGRERRLTPANPEGSFRFYADTAALSRDMKQIAYNWFDGTAAPELRVIELGAPGSPQPRVLYANEDVQWIAPADWAPDGSWIAVTLQRKDRSVQLGRVSVASGGLQVLLTFPDWHGLGEVAISPDGRFIAFDRKPAGTFARDINVLLTDLSRELTVVENAADDILVGWSPDGGILFASDRGGIPSLYLLPFDGSMRVDSPSRLYPNVGVFRRAGVSADGSVFALPTAMNSADLKTIEVDFNRGELLSRPSPFPGVQSDLVRSAEWDTAGKQLAYSSVRRLLASQMSATLVIQTIGTGIRREVRLEADSLTYPRFSPDGTRLVVVGYASGRQTAFLIDQVSGQTSVIASTQGPDERLVGGAGPATASAWSEDGRRVFYRRMTNKGYRVLSYDVDTRNEREIFAAPDPQGSAALTPDGRRIYFRRLLGPSGEPSGRQHAAFVERDLTTGAERELMRRFNLGAVTLSPDGRLIVTGSINQEATSRTILVVSTTDGTTRELLTVPLRPGQQIGSGFNNPIIPLAWALDSQSVLIRREPVPEDAEVWWAPVDGRKPRLLLTGPDLNFGVARVHPDGRRVVYAEIQNSPAAEELRVLQGLLPASVGTAGASRQR